MAVVHSQIGSKSSVRGVPVLGPLGASASAAAAWDMEAAGSLLTACKLLICWVCI